eukprot:CAMPEP_0116857120 /NCGR_PEP_ID=MMETSP0418-20121206/20349_1 /TAXON_ID=1158023 /ORGANISM="Astrosyne radiata, Strain 13vi08-1A" /LENGTH=100 /DNA_ID=CAMNT_0004490713 /DNA_START=395 /DNA_END=694 /DNA_ORIENTATION=+
MYGVQTGLEVEFVSALFVLWTRMYGSSFNKPRIQDQMDGSNVLDEGTKTVWSQNCNKPLEVYLEKGGWFGFLKADARDETKRKLLVINSHRHHLDILLPW